MGGGGGKEWISLIRERAVGEIVKEVWEHQRDGMSLISLSSLCHYIVCHLVSSWLLLHQYSVASFVASYASVPLGLVGSETFMTPEFVPEDSDSKRSQGFQSVRKIFIHKVKRFSIYISDLASDPRIGPSLLLGACLLFGTIWLQSNRIRQPTAPSDATNATRARNRSERTRSLNNDRPASITDEEPKNAYQWSATDSDSE